MNDYELACSKSWAIDHALQVNKGKKAPVSKIINDAAIIHKFITGAADVEVINLVKNGDR